MIILIVYVLALTLDFSLWGVRLGNKIHFYLVPIMALAVIALAYSWFI